MNFANDLNTQTNISTHLIKSNIIPNIKPMVIAIFGGSNSGKTTLASIINNKFKNDTMLISQDRFYYGTNNHDTVKTIEDTNYDHPKSIAFDEYVECVKKAKNGYDINVPIYDFLTHSRSDETEFLEFKPIIIIEGILIMTCPELVDLCDFKVYVHAELDTMYRRRCKRDKKERHRTEEQINAQWDRDVKPMFLKYVKPSSSEANITINNDQEQILTNPYKIPQINILLTYIQTYVS